MGKCANAIRTESGPEGEGRVREVEEPARLRPASFLVPRPHIMRQLEMGGEQAGAVFVCAPRCFGKTAVLLERVMQVRADAERGVARLVDARSMSVDDLLRELAGLEAELPAGKRPLVAIDNVPDLSAPDCREVAAALRRMRGKGFEFVAACTPYARGLMDAMGDSAKFHAQALRVQTREYATWASELAISPSIDIYGLTQGIPSLVAALRDVTDRPEDASALSSEAVTLYREVLKERSSPVARTAMMLMLMVGEGSVGSLAAVGVDASEQDLALIARDYPMFGVDASRMTFRCLDLAGDARARLQRDVADADPALVRRAARVLMAAGRVDDAVSLCERLMGRADAAELVAGHPVEFSLAGHAAFARDVAEDALSSPRGCAGAGVGLALARYVASIVSGDYRGARQASVDLAVRADRIAEEVDARAWSCAVACDEVWGRAHGASLPSVRMEPPEGDEPRQACALRLHLRVRDAVEASDAEGVAAELREALAGPRAGVDLSRVPLVLDAALLPVLAGVPSGPAVEDGELAALVEQLESRGLSDAAAAARMVRETLVLFSGAGGRDRRAFGDAGVVAVRRADNAMQLFCMVAEGWQNLVEGQAVNARFRGQQALKLMGERPGLLHEWAYLLERCAYVRNTSLVALREDAGMLDLERRDVSHAEAWATAIHLSSVRYDAELSYWYSLHRDELLDGRFAPIARLALSCFARERLALARLLPDRVRAELVPAARGDALQAARVSLSDRAAGLGQVSIRLLGGFRVEKNGYALTNQSWRRRKAIVLAERLALCLGSYVPRAVIIEELWPDRDYAHGREGLYVTLSALRKALGQRADGPQYLLAQEQSLALNPDFVSCDTAAFDALARDVLLHRKGLAAPQIIEACLAIDELYKGPLFVPEKGATAFFAKARREYLSRFVDCMISGCMLAVEEGQLNSAAWIVRSALRHAPTREDVIRCAMRVLDLQGRRREIVELYNGHLHYLSKELNLYPEKETRELYERIVGSTMDREML